MLYNKLILVVSHYKFSLISLKHPDKCFSYQGPPPIPKVSPLPLLQLMWQDHCYLLITRSVASSDREVTFLLVPGFLEWTQVCALNNEQEVSEQKAL